MFGLQKKETRRSEHDELSQRLRDEIEKYSQMNAELRKKHKEADDIIKEAYKLRNDLKRRIKTLGSEAE